MIFTLTKHENTQTVQQQQLMYGIFTFLFSTWYKIAHTFFHFKFI